MKDFTHENFCVYGTWDSLSLIRWYITSYHLVCSLQNDSGEGVHVVNQETLHFVSSLLRVEQETLSSALTTRTSRVGGMDSFVTHYSLDEVFVCLSLQ